MRKLIFIMATLLPLFFVACNKEEEPTSKIVGLWELSQMYFPDEQRWYNAEVDIEELHEVEFKNDGSGQFNDYYKSEIRITPFYWVLTDTQLRLVVGADGDRYEAYRLGELNDNELIIQNDEATSYYKRVNKI